MTNGSSETDLEAERVAEQFAGYSRDNALAMPPKVAAAIGAVMKAVPKLKKGEKNTHGNYNFASIDDFLEAVRPLCAKNGLIIIQDEAGFDLREGVDKNGKTVRWLLLTFQFTLAHTSGETWARRPKRTIMVNAAMGAQAFGAAQSYALKQFQRSLFQIATGEKGEDADSHPPGDLPTDNTSGWPKKTALKAAVRTFQKDGKACTDYDQLIAFLNMPESLKLQKQCQEILSDWWFGTEDSDTPGIKYQIEGWKVDLAAEQPPVDA